MKDLLWAILLVLLGIAFPILWPFIIPILVILIIKAILCGIIESVKQVNTNGIMDDVKDEVEFWKGVLRANPTRKEHKQTSEESEEKEQT